MDVPVPLVPVNTSVYLLIAVAFSASFPSVTDATYHSVDAAARRDPGYLASGWK